MLESASKSHLSRKVLLFAFIVTYLFLLLACLMLEAKETRGESGFNASMVYYIFVLLSTFSLSTTKICVK